MNIRSAVSQAIAATDSYVGSTWEKIIERKREQPTVQRLTMIQAGRVLLAPVQLVAAQKLERSVLTPRQAKAVRIYLLTNASFAALLTAFGVYELLRQYREQQQPEHQLDTIGVDVEEKAAQVD
jgi:FMN phosphatase YigB (HAD superfamily)